MIFNITIPVLTILSSIMLGYGIYQILFTRNAHLNAWVVRGLFILIAPVYLYLTQKYVGKIYLTRSLNLLIVVFTLPILYGIINGYLDTRKMRKDIDNHPGDQSYFTALQEKTAKNINIWHDLSWVFNWIKNEISAVRDLKNRKPKVENTTTPTMAPVIVQTPVLEPANIKQNRTLITNRAIPNLVSTQAPIPSTRKSGVLATTKPVRNSGRLTVQQHPVEHLQPIREPIQRPQPRTQPEGQMVNRKYIEEQSTPICRASQQSEPEAKHIVKRQKNAPRIYIEED